MMHRTLMVLCTAAAFLAGEGVMNVNDLIRDAYAAGKKEVTIPKGVYRMASSPTAHLSIIAVSNFTVNADGVTIIALDSTDIVQMIDCSNVTIRGLTIDCDPLNFSQGTVINIDPAGAWFEYAVHAGYPVPQGGDIHADIQVYDKETRLWKTNMPTHGIVVTFTGPKSGVWRGTKVNWSSLSGIAPGDLIAFRLRTKGGHGFSLKGSRGCTLDSVTIFNTHNFAVLDHQGGGNSYRNCRVTYGPTPPGAQESRLKSICRDGIHVFNTSPGPHIENCRIEGIGDDGIALHGYYSLIMSGGGRTAVVAAQREPYPFTADSTVAFMRGSDGTEYARLKVTGVTPMSADECTTLQGAIDKLPNYIVPYTRGQMKTFYTLTFDRDITVTAGDLLDVPALNGDHFTIRGNTIKDHRARGMLIKASEGVIENNTIDGSSMAAIVLSPEITGYLESGRSHNVMIRNNTIRNCGYEKATPGSFQAGIISITAYGQSSYAAAGTQSAITIEGNTIERCLGVNLLITSASDISVRGNHFRDTHADLWPRGESRGIDTRSVVWLDRVRSVRFDANTVTSMGEFGSSFVSGSTDISDIQGVSVTRSIRRSASSAFSAEQGKGGWHYRYRGASGSSDMTYTAAKKMWEGPEPYCVIYATVMHPGSTLDAVRSYMADAAARLRITGTAAIAGSGKGSDGVICFILKNDTVIWTEQVPVGTPVKHDIACDVSPGDIINFTVHCGKNNASDATEWDPLIEIRK